MGITVKGGVNAAGTRVPLPPPTLQWASVARMINYDTSRRWYNTYFPAGGVFVEYGAALLDKTPQGMLMYSVDGASYSLANAPNVPGPEYRDYSGGPEVLGDKVFLYIGDENKILPTYVYQSTDGINWTSQVVTTAPGTTTVHPVGVYASGAEFIGFCNGDDFGKIVRSTDGINWVAITLPIDPITDGVSSVLYDAPKNRWCFLVDEWLETEAGWVKQRMYLLVSYDGGLTFTDQGTTNIGTDYYLYETVSGPDNEYVALGYGPPDSNNDVFYRSTDLLNWTITYDVLELPGKWLSVLIYVPNVGYVSVGAASYATSSDGRNWKRVHTAHSLFRCYSIAQSPTVVASPQSSASYGPAYPGHFYFNKDEVTFDNLPPLVPLPTETDTPPPAFDLSDLPPHLRNPNGPWARRLSKK